MDACGNVDADQAPEAHHPHDGGMPVCGTDSEHPSTDSEIGMPMAKKASTAATSNVRVPIQLADRLPEPSARDATYQGKPRGGKYKCREGKEIREKKILKAKMELVENLTGDTIESIEKRLQCNIKELLRKGLLYEILAKDGQKYYAIFFTGSAKQKEIIKTVCDDPAVYPLIRHGGPWSLEPELLDRKYLQYEAGVREYVQQGWEYDASKPNLTLVWTIHTSGYEGIGRGGLQIEDEIEPHMTEPFAALTQAFQNHGIGSCFFREHLIKKYNEISNRAPMRILCMKGNEQSEAIAQNQELPARSFKYREQFVHPEWRQEYQVFESDYHIAAPRGCL